MSKYSSEIRQQPEALLGLINFYQSEEGQALLKSCDLRGTPTLLTGMGASFHAGQIAARILQQQGTDAVAVEAVELLNYHAPSVHRDRQKVYISQSGNSGEVRPLADKFATAYTVGITNQPDSTLAERSSLLLPLQAGDEETVATKTYLNTLALLSLLLGNDFESLQSAAGQIENMLQSVEAIATTWLEACASAKYVYFLGHGLHAVTAKQSAMMVSEWAKFPAAHAGIGAFRHGFIEVVDASMATVIFTSPGETQASAYQLADELRSYGARVLLVEAGTVRRVHDKAIATDASSTARNDMVATMLNTVAAQIFVEAFANHRQIEPGFRYIQKVVRRL